MLDPHTNFSSPETDDGDTAVLTKPVTYKINRHSLRTTVTTPNSCHVTEAQIKGNLFDTHYGNTEIHQMTFIEPDILVVVYEAITKIALDIIRNLVLQKHNGITIAISAEMRSSENVNHFGGLTLIPSNSLVYKDNRLTVHYNVVKKLLVPVS